MKASTVVGFQVPNPMLRDVLIPTLWPECMENQSLVVCTFDGR